MDVVERGETVVEFVNVQKSFGQNRVLRNLNLSIRQGEILTIMGGSGSGKSVTLKLLVGLIKPDRGQIFLRGVDITPLSEEELLPFRQRMGVVFQGGALFDSMTVGENVAYPLREHLQLSEKEIRERVAEKLSLVGLPGIEEQYPADLSGGMKKRVAIARAIVMEPEILLYDEPTAGLDPINAKLISRLIDSLQQKFFPTSVVVSHDLHYAFPISDRVAMLYQGEIIAVGSPEEMRRSERHEVREFLAGDLQPPGEGGCNDRE
ncbi:MAG: ABC transporter ATP-binding protein [Nitrospinota bacterium]|nr:MAG: ABC transporter ATP-binding protein [Nitrospinota bacterium]